MSHVIDRNLRADEQAQLRTLIARFGEVRAASAFGLSRHALLRAMAGLGVRHGTVVLIRARLPELDQDMRLEARS